MNKKFKIIYALSMVSSVILMFSACYIEEVKKTADYLSYELLRALHWFRIANIVYGIVIIIICVWEIYSIIKRKK